MDVVEVHQQKLSMPLQLLFILLGLRLERKDRYHRALPCTSSQHSRHSCRCTFSAIMFRNASNTLSATAMTHCIIPVMRGRFRDQDSQRYQQSQTQREQFQGSGTVTKVTNNLECTELQSSTLAITRLHSSEVGNLVPHYHPFLPLMSLFCSWSDSWTPHRMFLQLLVFYKCVDLSV